MLPTVDPFVFIEEQRVGYVRYRASDGQRWEQLGTCIWTDPTRWGPCGEGSVEPPPGPPEGRPDIPFSLDGKCSLCIDGGHLRLQKVT